MCKWRFAAGLAVGTLFLFAADKFQTDPSLVPVQTIITVEARHDHEQNVTLLNREDVMAYERQERLRVTDVVPLRAEKAGLELFLLLDDGSSASLGSQLGDLQHFIATQPATTSMGIGYMRNARVDVLQDLTTDHGLAAKALRLPLSSPGLMANPYLALRDLIERWPANSNRREVILVSSGVDALGMGPSNPCVDSAIEKAQRHGIVVYAIYTPGSGHARHSYWRLTWAQNQLAQISDETGGEVYMLGFGPPVSFAPYLEEITAHLANQYLVTFLMKAEDKGSLRSVRFATEVPGADLVAATRVYVPANEGP
jgi:hypothetical protein